MASARKFEVVDDSFHVVDINEQNWTTKFGLST
jgi:hypothetical protein